MRDRQTISVIIVVALLVYALFCFSRSEIRLSELEKTETELTAAAEELAARNAELSALLAEETGDEVIEQLARQQLGLVLPGEIVFYFNR